MRLVAVPPTVLVAATVPVVVGAGGMGAAGQDRQSRRVSRSPGVLPRRVRGQIEDRA